MKSRKSCNNAFKAAPLLGLLALLGSLFTGNTQAQQRPLWELGIGAAGLYLPYYRGSSSGRSYLLPFPYLIYRGDYLNVDEDGLRGLLYRSEAVALDISLAAGVPVPSDQNGPRQGMPDLDPTVEFGPSLELRLWHDQQHRGKNLWLHLPLRAAYSVTGSSINHEGWLFAPYLEFKHKGELATDLEHSISIGPMFADDAYHDYFYGVAPAYATASRPAYQGHSGYNGSRVTLSTQKHIKNFSVAAFIRLDSLNGASFTDSSLVQTRNYHLFGFALSWILGQSKQMVYSP